MATSKQTRRARQRGLGSVPDKPPAAKSAELARNDTPPVERRLGGLQQFGSLSRQDWVAALILCLLVAVSYFPAILSGFVWDDTVFTEEAVIREVSGLWKIWFEPGEIKNEGHYWPIVYSSFWLEHKLWGLAPMGYHIVNVVLHLVNCFLLWRLMCLAVVPGAWFIAAVFAVHPLHVESVAWVIERKDLLSALFYLASFLVWIRFLDEPGRKRYVSALSLFTAAMLSKSIAVTLPAALLLWQLWKQRRLTMTDLGRIVPFFVIALCITAADIAFYRGREIVSLDYSLVERALIAARALWFYLGKLLLPTDLAVIYPLWEVRIADPAAWAYLVAACGLAALLWFYRRRIGAGAVGRGVVLRHHSRTRAGIRGLRIHAVLVCRRPLPVPCRDRRDCRARGNRGALFQAVAASRANGTVLLGGADLGCAWSDDLEASGDLPRSSYVFRSHRVSQSAGAGRAS